MLYSLLKSLARPRKVAPEQSEDEVPAVSESTLQAMKRQASHARRMAHVKDAELNRLRSMRKMARDAKNSEAKARWQSSTIPVALDSRQQIMRKIDEIEIGMELHHASRMPRAPWKNTRPMSNDRGSRSFPRQAAIESPYTASVALINTGRYAAEQILCNLARSEGNSPQAHDTWSCLLGLLKAAGDKAAFDRAALDYQVAVEGAAPPEFEPGAPSADRGDNLLASALWICPPRLGSSGLKGLRAQLDAPGTPVLNWSRCLGIEASVSSTLRDVLARVASEGIATMQDSQPLVSTLSRQAAPLNAAPIWWLCLLQALRCMNDHDRYATVALEYFSRYEVSPPPWQAPAPVVAHGSQASDSTQVIVAGELEEMSIGAFDRLLPKGADDANVVLLCTHLVRLDFYSAAALVNWTAQRNARGKAVRLTGVHKLLGLYLKAIGLYDHASVELSPVAGPTAVQDTVC